ncbi:hypothetical protein HK103_005105 [Boothiomyces macroporosus]|uniref:xanthine dehydrogenase n=1 Tax=Boothiomyces macroporosus TaxID=261099 RepID=A0AAD5UFT3_9FUNG|nr:hypothetical protein HK103_005105 [Boothiomyces macroporosus]
MQNLSVNACLAPACSMHKKHVVTVEGLGNTKNMHPAQEILANAHGSQCGFCTPGIVMSLYTELRNNPRPTKHDIEDAFDGNLCRCTGYRPILDGAKKFSVCGNDCNTCEEKDTCEHVDIEDFGKKNAGGFGVKYPDELLTFHSNASGPKSFIFENKRHKWVHPSTKSELVALKLTKNTFPDAKIINGNTEVGIEVRFKNQYYPIYISTADVAELKTMSVLDNGVEWGSLTTIANLQKQLKELIKKLPAHQTRGFEALYDNIKYFAGRQVRNVSALAGNICTASPISDLNPVLVALGAILTVESQNGGQRKLPIREFFLGYRKIALQKTEVLVSVFVPFTTELQFASAFKQAKRRDDDIAIVNGGFLVSLKEQDGSYIVEDSCFAYGGMGPFALQAKKTSAYLKGKVWSEGEVKTACKLLLEDMPLSGTSPGGQIEYRKTLSQSFLYKFYLRVADQLPSLSIAENVKSALQEIHRDISSGSQVYQESKEAGAVGKAVVHLSATKQVTGEAIYVDDIPKFHNELYAIVVGSAIAHGRILSVDPSEALKLPGVYYISHQDVPKSDHHGDPNMIGSVFHDEELFATDTVHCIGQMIGLVLANTEAEARAAAKLVKVEYEKFPAIITTEEAIEKKSFFPIERQIITGEFKGEETDRPLASATHHVEGVARMSAQEHFYLETQASLVVPGREDDEMEVYAGTQNPTETQHLVAHVLGIPSNRVVCRVKRLGGGFGGKESKSVFLSCGLAIAARKLGRPVRCMLSREEDMAISGTRHAFMGDYKVGFTDEGKLVSLELDLYANAGYSYDLSIAVLERAMTHCDNSYRIPNMKLHGRLCKTNTPTNTAFRGFGGPQGMMIAEQYICHVAEYLGKTVEEFINFYKENEFTHFRMPLENVFLERAWKELEASSEFHKRKQSVEEFNRKNKFRKRGITIMPTKFGLAFTARFLNQAGALVHVYIDGSVRITHGGVEIGQGLHTKMVQIAAHELGVPIEKVFLSETRTDLVPNTSATAASVSSDINGMAVKNACEQILNRLKPIQEQHPEFTWEQVVKAAYMDRINLSANGFYKTPDLSYDWASNTGRMFSYFTYGACCAEVELDTLTGDHIVQRADVIMDIGRPINPAIDVGQIEGAFVQGMGWSTIEEPLYSPTTGFLLTRGPGLYKIPGFKDIPVVFNVTVMDGVRNTRAIHSSKAVGEPPLFLGAAVMFALREAIKAARAEQGIGGYFRLDSPATSERLRLSCVDEFVSASKTDLLPGEKPWGVPL